jgi:hypothetical protein
MEKNRLLKILIASPLEPEQAERIAAAAPGRTLVIYAPDLLPVPRYVADHEGRPRALSAEQRERWLAYLREADILFFARPTFCSTSTGWRPSGCSSTRRDFAGCTAPVLASASCCAVPA